MESAFPVEGRITTAESNICVCVIAIELALARVRNGKKVVIVSSSLLGIEVNVGLTRVDPSRVAMPCIDGRIIPVRAEHSINTLPERSKRAASQRF